MANEVLYSGLGDLRTAEVLGADTLLILADRAAFFQHPAIVNLGDAIGQGSDTQKIGLVGLDGYDEMAASGGEAIAVTNSALTDASATVSVARQSLRYEVSDIARSLDASGVISSDRFAASMAGSANMRLCSMIGALGAGFANTAGTSGVNMSHDDFMDAIYTLELYSVPGPYLCLLHPRQFADWQNSLRGEGGVAQWQPATAEMLMLRGPGFKGTFNGVDVVVSSKVPTSNAGADRGGCMFGRGAVGYKVMSVRPSRAQIAAGHVFAGPLHVAFERTETTALEAVQGNLYAGVVEIEDLRGVEISTDA